MRVIVPSRLFSPKPTWIWDNWDGINDGCEARQACSRVSKGTEHSLPCLCQVDSRPTSSAVQDWRDWTAETRRGRHVVERKIRTLGQIENPSSGKIHMHLLVENLSDFCNVLSGAYATRYMSHNVEGKTLVGEMHMNLGGVL